jgi:hypothetical protein
MTVVNVFKREGINQDGEATMKDFMGTPEKMKQEV